MGGKKAVRLRTVVLKDEKSSETHMASNSTTGVITEYKKQISDHVIAFAMTLEIVKTFGSITPGLYRFVANA